MTMKNQRHVIFIRSVLVLALLVGMTSAQASEYDETDDSFGLSLGELLNLKVVTIATGVKQTLREAPAVATVITAKDIQAMGATDLDEVLETVPGFHVGRDILSYNPIYAIRGIYSFNNPEVLVLVNGISIKTLYAGNRHLAWGGMPVNAIARIEIIRGPGSAVYGADAFAGVINIITKTKDDINGTETGLRFGSFNSRDAWLLHGGTLNGFDLALSLEYSTTNGHEEIIEADAQTHFDEVGGTNVSLAPGSVNLGRRAIDARLDIAKNKWQLRLGYQGRREMGTGAGISQSLDPWGRYEADRYSADISYHDHELTKYWDVTAQLSHYNTYYAAPGQTLNPPGFQGTYPNGRIAYPHMYEAHSRFEMSGFYSGFEDHLVRVGGGYYYGDLYKFQQFMNFGVDPATGKPLPTDNTEIVELSDTPYAAVQEKLRKNWHVFLQDAWNFSPGWELTTGLRYDQYSDFGTTVNPRMALVWETTPALTSKILYGHAFRAPSFLELYNKSPLALGNPNLKPEKIQTLELAFDYQHTDNLHFNFNLFTYRTTDVVRFQFEPNAAGSATVFSARNAGSQEGRGLELEARWTARKNLSLLGSYALQKSVDKETDYDVGNAPQHTIYLRSDWRFAPRWYLNTQVNWIADRKRPFGDPRAELDDYATTDMTLRYVGKKKSRWHFTASVRNLFDTDAREPSPGPNTSGFISIPNDLPLAGRSYFIAVGYNF